MKKNLLTPTGLAVSLGLVLCLCAPALAEPSLKQTMDGIVARFYADLDEKARATLERTALACPVHKSLLGEVAKPMRFEYTLGAVR